MKKRLKTLFYGMSHEHAPGKIATLRRLADDFDVVAIADDTARRSPSFLNSPFDAAGCRVVTEDEAMEMSDIDVVLVETANRDLMEIAGIYAERGIAMHCDKPCGEAMEPYRSIVEKCRARNVPLQIGYMYRGNPALSWTRHSEYIVLPEDRVYRLPDNVSFEAGALAHIATFPMAAMRKCRLELGESAIVMGQGILGQIAVMLLKCAGATPVIAADPIAEKREQALKIGADLALDPTAPDFREKVLAACPLADSGIYTGEHASGVKVAIEVTGIGAGLNSVLDVMAPMGRVALLGCTRSSDFTVDYYHKVHGRGIAILGAHTWARPSCESSPGLFTHRDDAQAFLRLLSLGRLSVDGYVADVRSPADCGEVYARLAKGGAFPVTQFDWTANLG